MTYPATPARFVTKVGERYTQSASWGRDCPSAYGGDKQHWQSVDWPTFDIDDSYVPERCDHCGASYDGSKIWRGSGTHIQWSTEDGALHPGDLFFVDQHHSEGGRGWCNGQWTNCDGWHLHARLPNDCSWDIDSRASNCTLLDDHEHRCWVRHGEPPNVTVDKNGRSCAAGAGSVMVADYHGFLRDGVFTAG